MELQTELEGIACTVLGLMSQYDPDTDQLTEEAMQNVLFSLQHHILRVAEDVGKLETVEGSET